jgi:hypothetical protein
MPGRRADRLQRASIDVLDFAREWSQRSFFGGRSESERGQATEEVSTMRTIHRFFPRFDGLEGKALTSGLVAHTGHAEAVQPDVIPGWGSVTGTWSSSTPPGDRP